MKVLVWIACTFIFSISLYDQKIGAPKINGVSFVAAPEPVNEQQVEPLFLLHANYVALMPFAFIRNVNEPQLHYNTERQWFGETSEGITQSISVFHKRGIKVMLKPQIWIWNGEYTGTLKMLSETDWRRLEASYKNFILEFAKVAEATNVEIFCIGTELEQFIVHRPEYWLALIEEIKSVYTGKLTYAANWDEYARVPFWEKLDYVGVDAYFPIAETKTPSVKTARQGWQKWKEEMQHLSEKTNTPILFIEFGYRNTNFAGKEPWQSSREIKEVNNDAQMNLLTALFEEFWKEPWMAGGFLWKWHPDIEKAGEELNNQFTVQNKPAQKVVQYYYSEGLD